MFVEPVERSIMLEAIFGSLIFEFIGVSAKWIFHCVKYKIKGKAIIKFKNFRKEKKDISFQESIEDSFSNVALGIIIIVILLILGTTFIK